MSTKKLPKSDGSTKFKSHIESTLAKTANSETPRKEKSQTATPPRITTSKMKNVGITDTKKYMVKISSIASKKAIFASKNNSKP